MSTATEAYETGWKEAMNLASAICDRMEKEAREAGYNIPAVGMGACSLEILKVLEQHKP